MKLPIQAQPIVRNLSTTKINCRQRIAPSTELDCSWCDKLSFFAKQACWAACSTGNAFNGPGNSTWHHHP
jgi:hypothetical protein